MKMGSKKWGRAETRLTNEGNTMNYKTLVAASLMSIALTSAAFAQCATCAINPDRDVYSNESTPASKMMRPGGATAASTAENNAYNARADARKTSHRSYRDANASVAEGLSTGTPAHDVYIKNLRDSGYSPSSDFDAAGNMKVN
jgi:hypothetical protein